VLIFFCAFEWCDEFFVAEIDYYMLGDPVKSLSYMRVGFEWWIGIIQVFQSRRQNFFFSMASNCAEAGTHT
jgi:hypothetical protein